MISSIPFIEGTNANAEGAWLADHPGLQLRSGLAILYKMDIRGSAEQEYEVTYRNFLGITTAKLNYTELNLNNFGWKKCYYDITTPLKTEYAAGEILLMVYDDTLDKGSGGWLVLSGRSYDAQTLQGRTVETQITSEDSDNIPTSGAVVSYIKSLSYDGEYNYSQYSLNN